MVVKIVNEWTSFLLILGRDIKWMCFYLLGNCACIIRREFL